MNITDNTINDLAHVYCDLLFLLIEAVHIVESQPIIKAVDIAELQRIDELLNLNQIQQISEATINLDKLINDTIDYYNELVSFYEKELYKKSSYNFSYLERFPEYRRRAIKGFKYLNERLLASDDDDLMLDDDDRIIISNFINHHLNSVNELLFIAREIINNSSEDTTFNDYVEKFQLQKITDVHTTVSGTARFTAKDTFQRGEIV